MRQDDENHYLPGSHVSTFLIQGDKFAQHSF